MSDRYFTRIEVQVEALVGVFIGYVVILGVTKIERISGSASGNVDVYYHIAKSFVSSIPPAHLCEEPDDAVLELRTDELEAKMGILKYQILQLLAPTEALTHYLLDVHRDHK